MIPRSNNFANVPLGELCEFTQGVQIADRDTYDTYESGRIRYLYIRDFFTDKFITYVDDKYPHKIMSEDDIMMVNTGNTAGNVYRGRKGVLSNNAFKISIKDKKVISSDYLWQFLNSPQKENLFKKLFNAAGQPHVGHKNIAQLQVSLPPLSEQEKIAKILSTWDEAIEKLESHFSKRSHLLAHQVENVYSQIQKTGKETDLRSVCSQIQDGTHSTPDYTTEGVPFYSVETLVSNNFNDTKYISKEDHEINIKRCRPEKGDLLLTRIGSLGVSKLIDWDVNASIYVSLALIKPNHDLVDSGYLYFCFQTKKFNKELLKRSLLNAAPQKINLSEIGNIPIYLPKDEATQKAAGRYVKGLKSELELLKKKIDRLKHQKQGLMQQLLTGKRRVKV